MSLEYDLDFEDDISLDKFKLDVEAEKQSTIYNRWGQVWADAESDAEEAKSKLDLAYAELYSYIIRSWKDEGLDKRPSDTGAESWILQQQKYKDALEHYHKENRISKKMKIVRTALENKKKMIEIEATLYGTGFWSKPEFNDKTNDIIKDIRREERNQRAQEKIRKSMNRRKEKEKEI